MIDRAEQREASVTDETTPQAQLDVELLSVVEGPQDAAGTVAYVRDLLATSDVADNPALLAEAAQLLRGIVNELVTGSLVTSGVELLPRPAVVRRAVDFIHTNARDDITTAEIAIAAGIGMRSLQMAFRRHFGQTPTHYLRGVRLAGAHADLQAGDSTRGATVTGIAKTWQFHHPGRFSMDYRRVYGHTPSRTLRA